MSINAFASFVVLLCAAGFNLNAFASASNADSKRPPLFKAVTAAPANASAFQIDYSVNHDGDGEGEELPPSIAYYQKADFLTSMAVTDLSLCVRPVEKEICQSFLKMISDPAPAFGTEVTATRISGSGYTTTFLRRVDSIAYAGVDRQVGFLGVEGNGGPGGDVVMHIYARKGGNLIQLSAKVGECIHAADHLSEIDFLRRYCEPDAALLKKVAATAQELAERFRLAPPQ